MNVNKIKMNAIYRKQTFTTSSCFDFHNPMSIILFFTGDNFFHVKQTKAGLIHLGVFTQIKVGTQLDYELAGGLKGCQEESSHPGTDGQSGLLIQRAFPFVM